MMKKFRIGMSLILMIAMLLCNGGVWANADTVGGQSEENAIELTWNNSSTAKLPQGNNPVYFKADLNEIGKFKISLDAGAIGTSVNLEIYNRDNGWVTWNQKKKIKYSKSGKKTAGSMTTEYVLPAGKYIIKVTPGKNLTADRKIKLTAKMIDKGYENTEPNFPEEKAQPMRVSGKGGTKTYKMLLSNIFVFNGVNNMDCFSFKLKEKSQFHLKASMAAETEELSVRIYKRQSGDVSVVKDYPMTGKKLDKTVILGKGNYILKVWYYGQKERQIPYTISGTVIQKITAVKLNKSKLALWADKKYGAVSAKLSAKISPSNATNKKVTWKSSNPKVAKVSSSGRVTAVSAGKAVITARAADGSKKYAGCTVIVKAPTPKIKGTATLTTGSSAKYTTTVPGGKWKISDKNVLSCVSAGKNFLSVKAGKPGKATISYVANGVASNKLSVTVKAPVPKITGASSVTVGADVKYTSTVSGGKWKSSDTSVLSCVSAGNSTVSMRAKKPGKVTVSYVANGIESNKIYVTVAPAPEKPDPNPVPKDPDPQPKIKGGSVVWVGKSITFTVTNGVNGGKWYSGDTSVLSGGGSGESCTMSGKKAGTTYVYYKVNGVESNRIQVQVRGL